MVDLDLEVLYSPGFVLLAVGALGATIIGYIWSGSMGWEKLPIWQLMILICVELVACYYFASKA